LLSVVALDILEVAVAGLILAYKYLQVVADGIVVA
jgi:hypothetical protein